MNRLVATAVNGLEYARTGGLDTGEEPSPHEVVAHESVYRLRRYFPDDDAGSRAPVLLVPPLMLTADVWDVSPQASSVAALHEHGLAPWVVDFGDPDEEPGGSERDVTDHVLAVVDAIDRVRDETGQDPHIGGYSQGGLFCYQAAAYRGCEGVASIFALGSPVDSSPPGSSVLPEDLIRDLSRLGRQVLRRTGVPGWALARAFKWTNPARAVRSEIEYLLALHDREALLPREGQRRFLAGDGWVSWSGPALAELMDIAEHGRFFRGGMIFGDRTVTLADITCPVLLFVGEKDGFGPPHSVRAIARAAPHSDVYELVMPVGHFGLGVGRHATKHTWPALADWVRWTAGDGDLPDEVQPVDSDAGEGTEPASTNRGLGATVVYGLGRVAQAGLSAPGAVTATGRRAVAVAHEASREVAEQVPRLLRLESIQPRTRISYGSLLDDAAERHPDRVCFLFEDRAHTNAAAKRRIDNIARGCIEIGVRKGEHIGVLMGARPSALTAVAALNRVGAVAVLLRPDGPLEQEADLSMVSRVLVDPEHAKQAKELRRDVFVLGGVGSPRNLPADVTDMEAIDPDAVELPAWYTPNPGRARDLAFILFTGNDDGLRADRITNGRWAQSALGAATAASLTPADTVYSVNPLHHASGLLLATAGPAAAGAKLAMTRTFDPDAFWSEVRRYGITVVPYTWTMLHRLVTEPPRPEEDHHPIRLFVGSGMPTQLARRVRERLAPAGVLELYASTRTGAILGEVSGRKHGAVGRPLPGTPRVRVARFDTAATQLAIGQDGLAIPTEPGETGMLLVEADSATPSNHEVPLRGVFAADDAWFATGDLFQRDEEGDLWFVETASALLDTADGQISPRAIEEALAEIDAVDLAACYQPDGEATAVAAVVLRDSLTDAALAAGLEGLATAERPHLVHAVDEIPMTSWHRPDLDALRASGPPAGDHRVWLHEPESGRYSSARTSTA